MPNLSNVCQTCRTEESKSWWKCCPKHTSEKGVDVVCEECANRCMGKVENRQQVVEVTKEDTKLAFCTRIADYVETSEGYEKMTKRDAVMSALRVLTNDIGAAQDFIYAIGLKVDLYDEDNYKE